MLLSLTFIATDKDGVAETCVGVPFLQTNVPYKKEKHQVPHQKPIQEIIFSPFYVILLFSL